MLILTPSGQS